jgi:hypothetical protein
MAKYMSVPFVALFMTKQQGIPEARNCTRHNMGGSTQ